jgi:hypothetical protein
MVDNLWFNKYDEEAIKDLRDFIPKKIFDVHAHIYRQKDLNLSTAWIFLEFIRKETTKRGILLIFDEIIIGWRHNFGGAHFICAIDA